MRACNRSAAVNELQVFATRYTVRQPNENTIELCNHLGAPLPGWQWPRFQAAHAA